MIAAALELGVESMTSIRCNEFGTPFLDSVFSQAHEQARFPILCYVNSDIILMDSFMDAVARIDMNRFLAIGQRTNLDLTDPIDFSDPAWRLALLQQCAGKGKLFSSFGIDYFVFTRNSNLHNLPPFLVGRPRWDNWFIFNARKRRVPIVDMTSVCLVIHQNHGYAHIPQWGGKSWNGPEAVWNSGLFSNLVGNTKHVFSVKDSTFLLTKKRLLPALQKGYLFQRLQTSALMFPMLRFPAKLVKFIYLKIHTKRQK